MDKDWLERRLTPNDYLACFRTLGFEINGHRPNGDGFISGIKGPKELGEGENGDFSVSAQTGGVKDFGSTGYTGDLYSVVQDVLGLDFPEAVEWIADLCGVTTAANGAREESPEKPRKASRPKRKGKFGPVPVSEAEAWSEALLTNDGAFETAVRTYLTEERGLPLDLIKFAALGARRFTLKVKELDWQPWHYWLFIPHTSGEDPIPRYQLFAFDPEAGTWKRTESGKKITRSRGSVDLYDIGFEKLDAENFDRGFIYCEGVIDALSVMKVGYPAITETHGANKTTPEIAGRIAQHPLAKEHPVTIAYDADDAGRKGRRKAARLLSEAGVEVQIADLPEGKDVNDVLQEDGREALQEIIGTATAYGTENDKNDRNDTAANGGEITGDPLFFPADLYDRLPETLRRITGTYDTERERAVFLAGALPVLAGACPNVLLRYGRQWHALNVYFIPVAPPGSGKNSLRHARRTGEIIDKRLLSESNDDRQRWEQRREAEEGGDPGPRPPLRSLYPAGDNSAAGLKQELAANPHGVVFETEITTLATALAQEWGQFQDVLLKGAMNEPVGWNRKGDERGVIDRPAPSLALTGTPHSFSEIITGADDGLFSRCNFLVFGGGDDFRDMFEDDSDEALDMALNMAAGKLDTLRAKLEERAEPLYVKIGEEQRRRIVEAGRYCTKQVKRSSVSDGYLANVRRAALTAFRIAGLLRLLRLADEGKGLSETKSIEVGADDVTAGLTVALTCLEHAAFLSRKMRNKKRYDGMKGEKAAYFEALPVGTFDTAHAKAIATPFSFSERTAERYLKAYVGRGLLSDVKHGEWRKPQFAPVSFLSFLSF